MAERYADFPSLQLDLDKHVRPPRSTGPPAATAVAES
jgi:hypothetical protein